MVGSTIDKSQVKSLSLVTSRYVSHYNVLMRIYSGSVLMRDTKSLSCSHIWALHLPRTWWDSWADITLWNLAPAIVSQQICEVSQGHSEVINFRIRTSATFFLGTRSSFIHHKMAADIKTLLSYWCRLHWWQGPHRCWDFDPFLFHLIVVMQYDISTLNKKHYNSIL